MAQAEDAVSAREAEVREEVDRRAAKAHADLADEYRLALVFLEAEAKGRTIALRTKLDEAEQHERAAVAAQTSARADLTSARAGFLPFSDRLTAPRPSRRRMGTRRVVDERYGVSTLLCSRTLGRELSEP